MNEGLSAYLQARRSAPAPFLTEPGPDRDAVDSMLRIAARVPDHGKLAPWRFIVYPRAAREAGIAELVRIAERTGDERDRRNRAEKARAFAQAPLVIGVVSAPLPEHPKIPVWEQELSAGAVCLNLLHAASAQGFSAQWLTGWFAYDDEARRFLGLRDGERIAGFVHIGTCGQPATERERPDVAALTTLWQPGLAT